MRFPFLGSNHAELRIPYPEEASVHFGVYVRLVGREAPDPEALRSVARGWVGGHADEPIRSAVQEWMSDERLGIVVGERDMLPVPDAEFMRHVAPGDEELGRFSAATHLVAIGTDDPLVPPRAGLWAALSAARAVAEALDGVIFDPDVLRLLPLAASSERLPPEGRIRVPDHIMVPFSVGHRGRLWITTSGLFRFGLPELEVCDAAPNLNMPLGRMVNGLAQCLVEEAMRGDRGKALTLPAERRVDLQAIARGAGSGEPVEMEEGVRGWTTVRLEYRPRRRGSSFLRVVRPNGTRAPHHEWLNGIASDLFGSREVMANISSENEAMEAAHLRAVAELPDIRRRFQSGLQPGETLYLKHGFPTPEDGHEYMWVVVNTWVLGRIRGQLANDPRFRMDLRAGQMIDLREEDVYDWLLTGRDGAEEGGYTNRVLESEGEDLREC